jgi:hypothetical protein
VKRGISDWKPVGLNERPGLSASDLDALTKSLPVTPNGESLKSFQERLGWIAAEYRLKEAWLDAPPPSAVRKKLESIQKAARRLTDQLGVSPLPDEDVYALDQLPYSVRNSLISSADLYGREVGGYADHPPRPFRITGQSEEYLDFNGDSKLRSAIEHLQLIGAWSERASRLARQAEEGAGVERIKRHGSTGRQARNQGNEPLNDMIGRLGNLYRDTTGQKAGLSRTMRSQGKPTGPFVRFVLAVCERMQIPMTATSFEKRWRIVGPLVNATRDLERALERAERPDALDK